MSEQASQKQKKATALVLQGQSVSSAMLEAGYTPASAKNPKNLTQTKYFIDIMEKHGVTDDKIAKVLDEGLGAVKNGEADYSTRHKYMETALKVKKLTEGEEKGGGDITINIINYSRDEIDGTVDDSA